jgi:ABC-2 type transport system ATP-binding protein
LAGRVFSLPVSPPEKRSLAGELSVMSGVIDASVEGDRLHLLLEDKARHPLPERTLSPATPRFEDAFVDLLSKDRVRTVEPKLEPRPRQVGAAIEVSALGRRFGDFVAVDNVDFAVSRGEIFGLLGPNGAGKSTIFRMLCGLLKPTAGTARVAGVDLLRAPATARERIGYMAQKFSLYGELSPKDNLSFFGRVYGLARKARETAVERAMQRFELTSFADSPSGSLPLGVKQRLALAAALIHDPDILFLDEPTSGVDPLARRDFWRRIDALAVAGVTVLVTSHFMDEAEYCDRLAIINAGRIAAIGSPAALRDRVRTPALPEPSLEDAFIAIVGEAQAEARS